MADFVLNLTGNVALSLTDLIGAYSAAIVVEAQGSTSLVQLGGNYYLYNSGAGPQLQYLGAPVVVGQLSGWSPIAAETSLGRLPGRLEGEWRRSIQALDHR